MCATRVLRVMCELKAFQVSCFLVNRLLSEGVCYDLGESRYGSMRAFIYDCAKFSFAWVCTCIYLYTLLFQSFFRSLLSPSCIAARCLRFLLQWLCFSPIIIGLCNGELKCVLGTFCCTFLLLTRYFCIKRIHYCISIFLIQLRYWEISCFPIECNWGIDNQLCI